VRDNRFKAVHRGGSLDLDRHRQLAIWAADCAEHVLPLFEASRPFDDRPRRAIETARAWAAGAVSVGAAGHAVATAHMADHALGPAWYGVRAVRASAGDEAVERERTWQLEQLSPSIRALVLSALESGKFAR
jgi:hypothetical protein